MPHLWERVEETVADLRDEGTVGVSLVGPDGDAWHQHGDRVFNAASTFKIAVMIAAYRQIDAGQWSLHEPYTLVEADRTGGSGVLNHMQAGATVTFHDLVYLMISISDNLATDVLLTKVGIANVNTTMTDLGMRHSRVDTTIRDMFASMRSSLAGAPIIPATPDDYVAAITAILDGRAASADSCEAMQTMLATQQNHRRLARYMPPLSPAIRFGSKTGTLRGVCNDVGFFAGPNGRLAIAVYTENFADTHVAEEAIGMIARAAMADTGVVGPTYTS